MQAVQRRTDIRACLSRRTDASSRQETPRHGADVQLGTQTLSRCGLLLRELFYVPVDLHSAVSVQQSVFRW